MSGFIKVQIDNIDKAEIITPILGHVGDGNFHLCMLVDQGDAKEVAKAQQDLHERMIKRDCYGWYLHG